MHLELSGTHFEWSPEDAEDPADRRKVIEEAIERLWTIAANWTRSRGDWSDFQLVGYGPAGPRREDPARSAATE